MKVLNKIIRIFGAISEVVVAIHADQPNTHCGKPTSFKPV